MRSIEAMPQGTPEAEGMDTNFQSTPEPAPIEQPLSDGAGPVVLSRVNFVIVAVDMKTSDPEPETEEIKTEENDEDALGTQEPSEDKAEHDQPESSDHEEQNPSAAYESCKPLATILHSVKQSLFPDALCY